MFSVPTRRYSVSHGVSTPKRFFPYKGGQYFSWESWPEYKVDEVTLFLKPQRQHITKNFTYRDPQIQLAFRKRGAIYITPDLVVVFSKKTKKTTQQIFQPEQQTYWPANY